MHVLTPQTFNLEDREAWIKHLGEHGYVVLGNVLEPIDHATIFKQFAEDWAYVTPGFDFHNKETWTTDNSPMMWNKGMIYASGLGQANFMWQLRTHERILLDMGRSSWHERTRYQLRRILSIPRSEAKARNVAAC